jgi:hypothetical protein
VITADELRVLFDYNPDTGEFNWKVKVKGRKLGRAAGYKNSHGYILIGVRRKMYYAHRLAWLYVFGDFPECQIDHINCNKSDNRISNLRLATGSQNKANSKLRSDSKNGLKGIKKKGNRWKAKIKVNGVETSLGIFDSKQDAHDAYCKAALELFREFARFE